MLAKILYGLLGLVPSIIWLWYFYVRDTDKEPKRKIFNCFFKGIISAFIALFFQWLILENFNLDVFKWVGLPIGSVLVAALIEELSKFGMFRFNLYKNKFFDDPVDSIIYMVSVAMGFAAVENIVVFLKSQPSQFFYLFILRFVTATLLHAVTAAIIGYNFSLYQNAGREGKDFKYLFIGLGEATILHAIYNLLIHFSDISEDTMYSMWLISLLLLIAIFITSYLTSRLDKNNG